MIEIDESQLKNNSDFAEVIFEIGSKTLKSKEKITQKYRPITGRVLCMFIISFESSYTPNSVVSNAGCTRPYLFIP